MGQAQRRPGRCPPRAARGGLRGALRAGGVRGLVHDGCRDRVLLLPRVRAGAAEVATARIIVRLLDTSHATRDRAAKEIIKKSQNDEQTRTLYI